MVTTISMSPEEYDELVTKQNEPSEILQETVTNYKTKLDEALSTISELEASLSRYIIGGARVRVKEPIEDSTRTRYGSFDEIGLDEEAIVQKISEIPKLARKTWTEEDLSYIHSSVGRYEYSLVSDLARVLDRSEAAIRSKCIQLGYKVKRKRIIEKET